MSNATFTNIDTGRAILRDHKAVYRDDTINFAGADTYAEGTILARRTSDSKLVPYVIGGSGGAEIPLCVLPKALTATGAGDQRARVCTSGVANQTRLVVHADGDGSNLTEAILDALRSAGVDSEPVQQLGEYDNT